MKRVLMLLLVFITCGATLVMADDKKKKTSAKTAEAAIDDSTEVHWVTLDELQVRMKKEPRKVFMDVYTDWCGWCKKMEATTFKNKDLVRYMNHNFYAVRLNAEQRDSIRFVGKTYGFVPDYKANMFAVELLRGQMSYPTSIIMEENYQNPQPIPGYQTVNTMEMILKFFAENAYKSKSWDDFQKDFKSSWMM